MCKKQKGLHNRIDKCMVNLIKVLKNFGFDIRACCCGHYKYNMSIVCYDHVFNEYFELLSLKDIPRTRNFYKKDKQGYYYIPEVENGKKNT